MSRGPQTRVLLPLRVSVRAAQESGSAWGPGHPSKGAVAQGFLFQSPLSGFKGLFASHLVGQSVQSSTTGSAFGGRKQSKQ